MAVQPIRNNEISLSLPLSFKLYTLKYIWIVSFIFHTDPHWERIEWSFLDVFSLFGWTAVALATSFGVLDLQPLWTKAINCDTNSFWHLLTLSTWNNSFIKSNFWILNDKIYTYNYIEAQSTCNLLPTTFTEVSSQHKFAETLKPDQFPTIISLITCCCFW